MGNEELIRRSGIKPLSEILKARRILAGHVLRQTEDRPANLAMSWIPEDGRRPKVRSQTNFAYDVRRRSARSWSIWSICAEKIANDCQRWKNLVSRCSNGNWMNEV